MRIEILYQKFASSLIYTYLHLHNIICITSCPVTHYIRFTATSPTHATQTPLQPHPPTQHKHQKISQLHYSIISFTTSPITTIFRSLKSRYLLSSSLTKLSSYHHYHHHIQNYRTESSITRKQTIRITKF